MEYPDRILGVEMRFNPEIVLPLRPGVMKDDSHRITSYLSDLSDTTVLRGFVAFTTSGLKIVALYTPKSRLKSSFAHTPLGNGDEKPHHLVSAEHERG